MASILDKYKSGTGEKKRSSILDRYREQPQYGYSQVDTSHATPYRPNEVEIPEQETIQIGGQSFPVTDYSDHPSRDIPVIGSVLRTLDKVKEFTRPVAEIGGALYTPGAGLANTATMVGNVGSKIAQVAPQLANTVNGRIATEAIKEGVTGVPLAMGQALAQGQNVKDSAKQGLLYGGVGGAAVGGSVGAIGVGLSKVLQTWAKRAKPVENEAIAQLMLPAPKQRGNANQAITDDVIIGQGRVAEPLGLPYANYNPSKLKEVGAEGTLNNVMERIKPIVTERMTPPYENPNELAKWVKNRLGSDASLNEVRELPYEDLRQMAELMRREISLTEEATIVAKELGYDLTSLLDGKLPSVGDRVAKDSLKRVSGVYDAPNVGLNKPKQFRTSVTGKAEIKQGLGFDRPVKQAKAILDTPEIQSSSTLLKSQNTRKDITAEVDNLAKQLDSFDPSNIKDLGGFNAQTRDIYRNLEATLGDNAKPYIEAFDLAKKDNIEMQEYWLQRMKKEVVDKLGITKGSKLSGLVQKFGEGRITEDELKKLAPDNWQKVIKADKWFRESYDNMIDIVNESRLKIYPNNPDKIVPKRKDYYRHFKDMEGIAGLKNLFETPSQISPGLSGLSEFVKPKSKFAGFMQKRGLGSFKDDAVGGFLEYVPSASYSTKIDPQIEVFRSLSKALADTTDETRNVNNLIEYLQDYANNLAGKTNPADRFVQKVIGRRTMGVIRWVNNRVKTNTILGNVGSLLAQLGNVPNGVAATKQHAIKGAGDTMASMLNRKDALVNQSPWLKERYFNTREFDTKWFEQPKKLAAWAIETADRVGTEFIWNSAVRQAKAQNIADPIAYADDLTRKMVAGRGVGEQPLIQGSAAYQVLAPFTLEVMNAWRVMGDFVKKKDITAIMTLFVGSYMFNKFAEEVRGSGVVFDPIDAMVDAFESGLSPIERGGRLVGEVLSNVPMGDKLAAIYPEYGFDVKGIEFPTREQAFGENDPTRFGGGLTAVKGIQDPLYKLIPPFGGNQLKKTIQGVTSLVRGGYEKDDKLRFPIERTPTEIGKAIAFGPNGTSAAQEYYDNDRRPLSEDQTESYELLPKDQRTKAYVELMRNRLEDNAKRVMNDETLTEKERKQKIEALQKKFDELKD